MKQINENIEKLIEAMGMMAENMQRQALDQSMAYTEKDFRDLLTPNPSQEQ